MVALWLMMQIDLYAFGCVQVSFVNLFFPCIRVFFINHLLMYISVYGWSLVDVYRSPLRLFLGCLQVSFACLYFDVYSSLLTALF